MWWTEKFEVDEPDGAHEDVVNIIRTAPIDRRGLDKHSLLNFLGYGNPIAEAVFVGMEEGFTEGVPLVEQLRVRSAFPPLIDIHQASAAHPEKYLSGDRPPIQSTWNLIIRTILALEGNTSPTTDDIRFYQRDRLGRTEERGALLELFPLPAVGLNRWPYAELFEEFPTREVYREVLLPQQIEILRRHLAYGPALVVCYGKAYWAYFEQLFPGATWSVVGPFRKSVVGSTTAILTPHFTSREFNGRRESFIGLVTRGIT